VCYDGLARSRGRPSARRGVASVTTAKKGAQTPKEESGLLGIPPSDTIVAFQTEVFKELINKFSWALGSTYRCPYSNQKTDARQLAIAMAKHVVGKQGYPTYMRK